MDASKAERTVIFLGLNQASAKKSVDPLLWAWSQAGAGMGLWVQAETIRDLLDL